MGAALSLLALGLICHLGGLRVNTSKSIPIGLYHMTDESAGKGKYVIFCPPESELFDEALERGYIGAGFCPGGYGYMMKRVLAVANDCIDVTGEGVGVNGQFLEASKAMKADSADREMPRYFASNYTLKDTEMLLMADSSGTSFDSRYFGPVELGQVRGVIRPLITF